MRYSGSEKAEIIRTVERSYLSARQTLDKIGIPRTTFYRWYDRYLEDGIEGLEDRPSHPGKVWNQIPEAIRDKVIELALDEPEFPPRELAVRFTDTEQYFISEASVYRMLKAEDMITSPAYIVIKASDEFKDKPSRPNQQWQTDFTYLKIKGWGWYYLSTILDDYSHYIISWKLCSTMKAKDVTDTLDLALEASGCDNPTVIHKPRLLSDNGASYIAKELAEFITDKGMSHVRGRPYPPQTQGKIERWHQTLKNRILLDNYFLPSHLEHAIGEFIEYYNHHRYHESLQNLTPVDVYYGRGQAILEKRRKIKKETLKKRRLQHQIQAA
jgi:transposase InsO family protein/transposase-like protein